MQTHVFLFRNFYLKSALNQNELGFSQGLGEKESSKNFAQLSKCFKSELMSSISQLYKHAPRRTACLCFDSEKQCSGF